MIIGLEAPIPFIGKEVFNIKITDKSGAGIRGVTVTDITVDEKTIIEKLWTQSNVNLNIRKVTFVASYGRSESEFVGYLT